MLSYAQNFEDVYIARAFKDLRDGFYIDLGAFDPFTDSVTAFFYHEGWNGINIEPGPFYFRFNAQRPRDINLNVAVASHVGYTKFFFHEDDPGSSTLSEQLDERLASRVHARTAIEVPTKRLNDIFEEYAMNRHVHFLKMDIEGLEKDVIVDTDWRAHRPELLIIEATYPYTNLRRDDQWSSILSDNCYTEVFFDGINVYYLREESLYRKDAFLAPVNVLDNVTKFVPEVGIDEPAARLAVAPANLEEATGQIAALTVQANTARDEYRALVAKACEEASAAATTIADLKSQMQRTTDGLSASATENVTLRKERDIALKDLEEAVREYEAILTRLRESDWRAATLETQFAASVKANDALASRNGELLEEKLSLVTDNAHLKSQLSSIWDEINLVSEMNFYLASKAKVEHQRLLDHVGRNARAEIQTREKELTYLRDRDVQMKQLLKEAVDAIEWVIPSFSRIADSKKSAAESRGRSLAALLKKMLLSVSRSIEEREIKRSGLFDTSYYLMRYEDVRKSGTDPLRHYVVFGCKEGRLPHPLFDTKFYLTQNPDVTASGMNPLVHFIRYGLSEGRRPNALFSSLDS